MVSNQDGLGSARYPRERFEQVQAFLLHLFGLAGHRVRRRCSSARISQHENCVCRKPRTGLVTEYLRQQPIDRERSAMIGDRDTDLEFAQDLGIRGLRVSVDAAPGDEHGWPRHHAHAAGTPRAGRRARRAKPTSSVTLELDSGADCRIATGIGFFDHMLEQLARHGGFHAAAELPRRPAHRRAPHGRGLRAGAGRGAAPGARRQGRHRPLRLSAGDGRERGAGGDRPVRPPVLRVRRPVRPRTDRASCRPSWCRISFARWPHSLGAALHLSVRGENTHHMIEACFKGVGRALRPALRREGYDLPSTKGAL